ncbi:MAG: hypothetical protein GX096_15425 [Clostridiales bacterium]|nr:hypothetical protein [Clostridiales bacterium]
MKFLSNAHTHTPWCDGRTPILDMLQKARDLGFVSLGFSGHAGQGFDPLYSMLDGRQERYKAELKALQKQMANTAGSPRIWIGLELDSMADEAWRRDAYENFDYVIGSTHYLNRDYHGDCVSVDGDPILLEQYIADELDGDGLMVVQQYYDIHVDALLRDRPAIIGHFDLVRKYSDSLHLFDVNGMAYRKIALDALERAYGCGGVLEINTGCIARKSSHRPYPSKELLGAWYDMGGEITITSDCHDAAFLDCWFEEAVKLARSIGFKHVLRLGTADELWETVRL